MNAAAQGQRSPKASFAVPSSTGRRRLRMPEYVGWRVWVVLKSLTSISEPARSRNQSRLGRAQQYAGVVLHDDRSALLVCLRRCHEWEYSLSPEPQIPSLLYRRPVPLPHLPPHQPLPITISAQALYSQTLIHPYPTQMTYTLPNLKSTRLSTHPNYSLNSLTTTSTGSPGRKPRSSLS